MILKVYMFGVAKELFGNRCVEFVVEDKDQISIDELKSILEKQQPNLKAIGTYLIAANNEYAADGDMIHEKDEVAVIPPVSGG